jgi:hypothetical protein
MRTNAVLLAVDGVLSIPLIPLVFVSTFVLGLLVTLTFGLLLIPISVIWIVLFMGPLLGLSWLWLHVPLLRLPLAIIGIPIAALASAYAGLMPSMGETGSRATKLLQASTWPYSLPYLRWDMGRLQESDPAAPELMAVLQRQMRGNAVLTWYVQTKLANPGSVPG